MVMVAVCGGRSCGITTASLAIASQWGPRPVLLAECDPAGTSLVGMVTGWDGQPLSSATGLVPLGLGAGDVESQVQTVRGGLPVVVGPVGPEQATALGAGWGSAAAALAAAPGDVVADCGRLTARDSVVAPVLGAADLVVVMCRADVTGAAQLQADLRRVAAAVTSGDAPGSTRVAVVVADAPASPARRAQVRQVEEVVGLLPAFAEVPVLGVVAWDWRGAGVLAGQRVASRLRPSALQKSAAAVAKAIQDVTGVTGVPAGGGEMAWEVPA